MNITPHIRKVDGYNILYLAEGDPNNIDVIILLHGIGASSDRWLKVIPILSKHFYVIAPDIIGFGYSEKPEASYTIDFFVDFVMKFIESMNLKGKRITLLGSSLGGHIAAEFAIKYPDILSNLILVSPAGIVKHGTKALNDYILAAMYPTLENAIEAFKGMATDPDAIDMNYIKNFVNRMKLPNAKYAFLAALMGSKRAPNLKDRLEKIRVRTLIIWGEKDKLLPVEYAEEFKKMSNAQVVIMKSVGHVPFEEKPDEFCKLVIDFIKNDDK